MISQIPFPRKYLTKRGVIDARNIIPGDYVYEWRTNKLLEVKAVENITYNNMYEAVYSDERTEFYTNHELVYLEDYILPPHHPFCRCRRSWQFPITLYPIEFNEGCLIAPLSSDPYTAGSALIFGSHEESNLSKLIPDEYMYASVKERTQFLRGVFDAAYNKHRSPDKVAAFHKKECVLRWVQSMLWSIGVSSALTYETTRSDWKLEVRGKFDHYPGFFYRREYIENMINADYRVTSREYANRVTIVETRQLEYCPIAIHNPVPHIYLEKPHMIYTSVNYLPRISM